jgi:hypothetical protein
MKHLSLSKFLIICGLLVASAMVPRTVLAQRPYVISSFPTNGSVSLPCNVFIKASLHFPFESQILDPVTFLPENVKLYPAGQPGKSLPTDLSYRADLKYLTLRPREVLHPQTEYVFEVTSSLVDGRGFSFLPFVMRFETGECSQLLPPEPDPLTEVADEAPEALALSLYAFTASWQGDSLRLDWETDRNWPAGDLLLEHATEAEDFQMQSSHQVRANSWRRQSASFVDEQPPWGYNQYRLRFAGEEGEEWLVDSLKVFRPRLRLLSPQIPRGGDIHFDLLVEKVSTMAFILQNMQGKILLRKAGMLEAGEQEVRISLGGIPPGRYRIQFRTQSLPLVETIEILP